MYKYLSTCYDLFMKDVDYDGWADRLSREIGDRRRGVDCGCGSGMITYRLKKRGYDVIGMDVSAEMLKVASENFAKVGEKIMLVQMDSAKLKTPRRVDFITAVCDVVNYMKNPLAFFKRAYENLTDDGILLFDISSEHKLIEELGNNVFTESSDKVTYIWTNSLSQKKDKIDMFLTFYTQNSTGSYDKTEESQTQYIYSESTLTSLLYSAGFKRVKVEGKEVGAVPKEGEPRLFFAAYKQE